MHQAWIVGTTSFRRITVLEHSNSGLHAVAMALWKATVHPRPLLVLCPNRCGMPFLGCSIWLTALPKGAGRSLNWFRMQ